MSGVHYLLSLLFISGCSQEIKDMDIKSEITVKAKEEPAFAGVSFIVHNGVVTLSGNCPAEKSKDKVKETILIVPGVKNIVDHISVSPVILNSDYLFKLSVDSVLDRYAQVSATVRDSIITLQGSLKQDESDKLMSKLNDLHPRDIRNKLVMY